MQERTPKEIIELANKLVFDMRSRPDQIAAAVRVSVEHYRVQRENSRAKLKQSTPAGLSLLRATGLFA